MKISCHRLVAVVLLSIAAGMAFAGNNPMLKNPAGYGQSTVSSVCLPTDAPNDQAQMKAVTGPLYGAPDCFGENFYRAYQNADVPETLSGMRKNISFNEVSELGSIYHNLWENVPFNTQEERELAYQGARKEYFFLVGRKTVLPHVPLSDLEKKSFKYLNPDLPNVKFVERREDGAREAVYNKKTGELVKNGPNQGTWNFKNGTWGYLKDRMGGEGHHYELDELRAVICGVPTDEQNRIAKELWAKDFLMNHATSLKTLLGRKTEDGGQIEEKVRQEMNPVSVEDLKNMDLDDKNGDWCQCDLPGCEERVSEEGFFVSFVCLKCNKVNVSFAKKAIALEAKAKELGGDVKWFGPNAEQRAKSVAGNAK